MESVANVSAVVAASESIPTPDLDTSNPLEVYTREALIPDDEYAAISVNALIREEDDRSRKQLLPWSRGRWLESKLRSIISGPKSELKPKLCVSDCIGVYAS